MDDTLTETIKKTPGIETIPNPDGSTLIWVPTKHEHHIDPLKNDAHWLVRDRGTNKTTNQSAYIVEPAE